MEKVFFNQHELNSGDIEAVSEVINSRFITSGAVGKKVEDQISSFFKVKNALLTNSWTNGALACLLAMDIGPGDEVIIPAATFVATSNVVELLGATPVFVDVCPRTLLIEPAVIEAAITPKTKCVIAVHLYGQMCDMKSIYSICKSKKGVFLIEDAAHCFEGKRSNYQPGKYSDCAIFSFYATKNITCGEGGALITNNNELAQKIRLNRLLGIMRESHVDKANVEYRHWDMKSLGLKANLPDILAALLPRQIKEVHQLQKKRRAIASIYRKELRQIKQIRMQTIENDVVSAEHLFPIHVDVGIRDELIKHLNSHEIEVGVHYHAVTSLDYYKQRYRLSDSNFPVSIEWGKGTISLPLYPSLKLESAQSVISSLKSFFAE
jgi:UDP-4-amino-4-deoxy-L-arabinose-oxoglutarate aminotransferase